MPWAKLDDRFHSHPKVRGVWYRCPAAIGLHVMCIAYAADHETDGIVPDWFVAGYFTKPKDLEAAVEALTESRMWRRHDDGYEIHDFLKFNPSKKEREEKRAEERERKQREREERRREEEAEVST